MSNDLHRIAIRADASATIGTGHVMRCLTLAEAARGMGACVRFVCRAHEGHLGALIARRGFELRLLPPGDRVATAMPHDAPDAIDGAEPAHAAWIGAPWHVDAGQTLSALQDWEGGADWLVVDHYGIDERWERTLRSAAARILAIDDVEDRPHDCDLLLDPNFGDFGAAADRRYVARVPPGCVRLLGPDFAMLQPAYAALRDRIPPREGPVRRVFVYFGGADIAGLGESAVEALLRAPGDARIDVVLSGDAARADAMDRRGVARLQVHRDAPGLAPLIARADLAIGAAGATSWERLCLGLPSLAVTLAPNQRRIAAALAARKLAVSLGEPGTARDAMDAAVARALSAPLDPDWSRRCREAVDGLGVRRVLAAMSAGRDTPMRARRATAADAAFARRAGAEPDAAARFADGLRDLHGCRIYRIIDATEATETANAGGVALAQARFDRDGERWRVRTSVDAPYAGRGLEPSALAAALAAFAADGLDDCARFVADDRAAGNTAATAAPAVLAVCSDRDSWIHEYLPALLAGWIAEGHEVAWAHDADALPPSQACFYLSYGRLVGAAVRARHRSNLVVHESALPQGRGWSPLTWQVLEGKREIVATLFEAVDAVDAGPIHLQETIRLRGDELVDELRRLQAGATLRLCRAFVAALPGILAQGSPQRGEPSFYPRRTPVDSALDPDRPLREQLPLLRVSDPLRYPAWFEVDGRRYRLRIEADEPPTGEAR